MIGDLPVVVLPAGDDPLAAAMLADRLAQIPGAAALDGAPPAPPVVLLRADAPTLPPPLLDQAALHLRAGAQVVLGPADDGSLCVLGLGPDAAPLAGCFDDPAAAVERRAVALGLSVHTLPTWWRARGPGGRARLKHALLSRWWPEQTAEFLRRDRLAALNAERAVDPAADRRLGAWERQASRPVYATPWLRIREDEARMPDGRLTTYNVVDCGRCVGVLPFVDSDTVLMVRQYRYVAGYVTWEMPTGGVDGAESPEQAARRELAEEAQVHAARWEPLGRFHTSKSVMDETAWLYAAHDLTPASAEGDDTDFIVTEALPFARVLELVQDGTITDSMTIIAVMRVALQRGLAGGGARRAWGPASPPAPACPAARARRRSRGGRRPTPRR